MSDFRQHLDEELKNPEFREAWEASEAEYKVRKAIIEARAANGMTQAELAQAAGMNQRAVSRIETGNTNTTIKTLDKLAKGMGRSLEIRFV